MSKVPYKYSFPVVCKYCGSEIVLNRAVPLTKKKEYVCSKCRREGIRD